MTDIAAILARDAELREKATPDDWNDLDWASDLAVHRVNSFDALVAEIERLRERLENAGDREAYLGRHESLKAEIERLREAIAWACGERDRFYSEYERKNLGMPIYWWRKELQRRALGDSEPTT